MHQIAFCLPSLSKINALPLLYLQALLKHIAQLQRNVEKLRSEIVRPLRQLAYPTFLISSSVRFLSRPFFYQQD